VLDAYRGVRVVIAGASGFVGRSIWRLLHKTDAEVWALGRDGDKLLSIATGHGLSGRLVVSDAAATGAMRAVIRHVRPAIVFNALAYGVHPEDRDLEVAKRINTALPLELALELQDVSASDWLGQRLVHLGSAFEYGPVAGRITEETAPRPGTPYGRTKLHGTQLLSQADRAGVLRAVTARLFTVYGPGEPDHRLLPTLLRAAELGDAVDMTGGEQRRDFTFVDDVAEGVLRLGLARATPSVINLSTGTVCTVRKFAETAARMVGLSSSHLRFGAIPYRADEEWQAEVSTELLESTVDWRPLVTLEEGISATMRARQLGHVSRVS
jgi:nucleoside-diphosphate-sugar epimerase